MLIWKQYSIVENIVRVINTTRTNTFLDFPAKNNDSRLFERSYDFAHKKFLIFPEKKEFLIFCHIRR